MKHPQAVVLDAAQQRRLEAFAELLGRWNTRINLVSPSDLAALWPRHIEDSAQLASLLPPTPEVLVDLGSGAGFPGLVLAVLTSWDVHLVESDQRKAAFLREAARHCGVALTVHAQRAETLRLPPARIVTARALAGLDRLLPLAAPLLGHGGQCLFPKGRGAEDELTRAAPGWHMRVERFASRTSPDATILRISEIHRVGPAP